MSWKNSLRRAAPALGGLHAGMAWPLFDRPEIDAARDQACGPDGAQVGHAGLQTRRCALSREHQDIVEPIAERVPICRHDAGADTAVSLTVSGYAKR